MGNLNNRKIHVIVPMAGEGRRFKDGGFDLPKPLIEYDGKPMFVSAMQSLEGIAVASWTFVVRDEHCEEPFNIKDTIYKHFPNANIISIGYTTRGAAETVYLAIKHLILNGKADFEDSMVVMDCDVITRCREYASLVNSGNEDAILLTFCSHNDRYSFVDISNGYAVSTAEKKVLRGAHAITSPYHVGKIVDFIDAFNAMQKETGAYAFIKQDEVAELDANKKEMYMSNIYNYLLVAGKNVRCITTDMVLTLGTPEEYNEAKSRRL